MGTNILGYVPLTESSRAVLNLHYSLGFTSMTPVMILKVLKELAQEHPMSMFRIFFMPMTCTSQLTVQIICRPHFTG
eukprot:1047260-Pelagomonas_calceolata.AAC.1